MPKRIAIKMADGTVAIMNVLPGADKNECLRKFKELHVGQYVKHEEVNTNELPIDRSQRDKWYLDENDKKVKIKP